MGSYYVKLQKRVVQFCSFTDLGYVLILVSYNCSQKSEAGLTHPNHLLTHPIQSTLDYE